MEDLGTLRTLPAPGYTALVTRRSPIGEPLQKALRARSVYPPGAASRVPFDSKPSLAPVDTSTSCSAATLRRSGSPPWPRRWRHTVAATRCECIDAASAVAGQACAIRRSASHSSGRLAPRPPRLSGTRAPKKSCSFSSR